MIPFRERLSWSVVPEPGTPISQDRPAMARTYFYLFGIGGSLLLATLPMPHSPDREVLPLVLAAIAAYSTAVGYIVGFDRLPLWTFKYGPMLGSTMIGVVLVFCGPEAVGAYAMYFFWVALSAAYFFEMRIAFANMVYATGIYAVVLAVRPNIGLPSLHWAMAVGALFVAGVLVVQLRAHAERAREEADHVKAEFFASISHELRTPLTSITGYLDILRGSGTLPPTRQEEFLGVIDRNSRRLLRLVGDLLFIAQVQASGVQLERFQFDISDVASESLQTFKARAEREKIDLVGDIEPVGICVGDAGRIGQALDNLISNALKFTLEGGTIMVRVKPGGRGRALIEVADDGMGIPAAEQDRLFEDFYRASDARRQYIEGTGLGLAIVKTIVEGHEGEVTFDSREGVGTTFRISLPLAAVPAHSSEPAEALFMGGASSAH
jgi:signal transduction histidine kinase